MAADLLKLTAELVDIPSVSHHERAVTDHLEGLLAPVPWLSLTRVGDNLVARTELGRNRRLVLAGHTDTVPPNGNERARIDGDVLWGLGSCDMKSGVAVLAELARTVAEPAVDTTYVFYECEEVDSAFNGIERLFRERPDLLEGDAALLAEPTSARVEARRGRPPLGRRPGGGGVPDVEDPAVAGERGQAGGGGARGSGSGRVGHGATVPGVPACPDGPRRLGRCPPSTSSPARPGSSTSPR